MTEHDNSEHMKEVYARFGLAIYYAQVLEHGLVNALVVLDLIPSRQHRARSSEEWGAEVDAFMDRHFDATMGRMMKELRAVTQVSVDLERLLIDALEKRNWLVHDYFRERATEFMSTPGRERMLCELAEGRGLFQKAGQRLEEVVALLRSEAGITNALMEQEYRRLLEGRDNDS